MVYELDVELVVPLAVTVLVVQNAQGITVILVTHDLREAVARWQCGQVRAGSVSFIGTD